MLAEHEGARQIQIVSRAMKTHRPVFVDGAARRARPPPSQGMYCEPYSWAEFTELVGEAVRPTCASASAAVSLSVAGSASLTQGGPVPCLCSRLSSPDVLFAHSLRLVPQSTSRSSRPSGKQCSHHAGLLRSAAARLGCCAAPCGIACNIARRCTSHLRTSRSQLPHFQGQPRSGRGPRSACAGLGGIGARKHAARARVALVCRAPALGVRRSDRRRAFAIIPLPRAVAAAVQRRRAGRRRSREKKPGESVHVRTCRAVPCGFDAAWDLMPLWAVPAARRRLWSAWLAMVEPPSCDSLTVLLCWQRRLVCICMPKPLRLRSRTRL